MITKLLKRMSENKVSQFIGGVGWYILMGMALIQAADAFRGLQWRDAILHLLAVGLFVWLGWRDYWSYRNEVERLRSMKKCPNCGHSVGDD